MPLLALATSVVLGMGLAAPHTLSLADHASSGARAARRDSGFEARPPEGVAAVAQFVVPDRYGSPKVGIDLYSTQLERASSGFSGIVFALLLLPLGWRVREQRPSNFFWALIGILGASWALNLPGFTHVFRSYPLGLLSFNRFVFATSFAVLCIGVTGLDAMWRSGLRRHASDYFYLAVTFGLAAACVYWALNPLEPVATQLSEFVERGNPSGYAPTFAAVEQIQVNQANALLVSAGFATLAGVAWVGFLRFGATRVSALAIGGLALFELTVFAWDREPRSAPGDYPASFEALEHIAGSDPGRMLCVECLPPNLSNMYGLSDIRGYDGVDPLHYIELIKVTGVAPRARGVEYARLATYMPRLGRTDAGELTVHPILDLLNLRYVVATRPIVAKVKPRFVGPVYRVYENPDAMGRASVPRSVRKLHHSLALREMSRESFRPRAVAYVAEPLDLPEEILGRAEIESEIPTRISIRAKMETPGLLVLADLFHKDWHATVDGAETPVLRTNYAMRGVVVPAGEHLVEFRYEPRALRYGAYSMLGSLAIMTTWGAVLWRCGREGR